MQEKIVLTKGIPILLQFIGGAALVIGLSLWIFNLVMEPQLNDLLLMVLFLSITAVISVLAGYAVYQVGWINHSPTIRWTLLGGYGLASILTFLNVWVTARLMFASKHDLLLATVLLIFAGGIAMVLGFFLSSAITDQLKTLNQAFQEVAKGELQTRVQADGRDEIAQLAVSFNQMTGRLQEADEKKSELENLRRDLIAWVSHDLQTPLASIQGMVEALADGVVDDPETVQRYLTTTRREIKALSLLIDDLFQMAQLDAGGFKINCESGSLSDLISDTLESLSALAAQHDVTLQGLVEPNVDPVYMDARRLGRALNNLIGNGLRYTHPQGKVEVRAVRDEQGVEIEINDDGEGIAPEDIPHIFDRFFSRRKIPQSGDRRRWIGTGDCEGDY